ncbi:hypothetical protein YPPY113_3666, partial [Yersinia pestis PY-113]
MNHQKDQKNVLILTL